MSDILKKHPAPWDYRLTNAALYDADGVEIDMHLTAARALICEAVNSYAAMLRYTDLPGLIASKINRIKEAVEKLKP